MMKKSVPDVSIIIPVYNAALTLQRTVESILKQTYSNWEILIVDDGSTDSSASEIEILVGSDTRIRTLSQANAGVSAARNIGLAHAAGEWILFLDSDDWVSGKFLDAMLGAARNNKNSDAVYCGSLRVLPDGDLLPEFAGSSMTYPEGLDESPLASMAHCCPLAIHSVLVKKDVVEAAGRFDVNLKSSEDWDLWVRVARTGANFLGVPEPLAFYHMRENDIDKDFRQVISDAQTVLKRARQFDDRVVKSDSRYVHGHSSDDLVMVLAEVTLFFASVVAGSGITQTQLISGVENWPDYANKDRFEEAILAILTGLAIGTQQPHELLAKKWGFCVPHLTALLEEVEVAASQPGVAKRMLTEVENRLVKRMASASSDDAATSCSDIASHIPVLMYHSIADEGPAELGQWRMSPKKLAEQMDYLKENGFYSVNSADILAVLRGEKQLPGKPVMLSFDDGYSNFFDCAWPIIKKRGFTAEVFLVTDYVGGHAEWDSRFGSPAKLMDWKTIRELQGQGVTFGSHLASHRRADELTVDEMIEESTRSRSTLEAQLQTRINSVAMPFGVWDQRLLKVFAETGYEIGLTTVDGWVTMGMNPLSLPRVEVVGDETVKSFSQKLIEPACLTLEV